MIDYVRKKDEKWIFQKNISSKELIKAYLESLDSIKDAKNKEKLKNNLKYKKAYFGRSENGSLSTMGVRFSQMCFYMFGYKNKDNIFIPTQMTTNILKNPNNIEKNILINLFSIQFPHPYSKTPLSFRIYAGRLILKLLIDLKIDKKLYIDEFIWFLPFIKTIDPNSYNELVNNILEYRALSYEKKKEMFESVDNFDELFANCMHEIKYYFLNIFKQFGVLELVEDHLHNGGMLFSFQHGNTNTQRSDVIGKDFSGYVCLKENLIECAEKLLSKYSPFELPETMGDDDVYSKEQWINDLYDIKPLNYMAEIMPEMFAKSSVVESLNTMVNAAKFGSVDGKDFENSLKPVFELFDKVVNVEIISGAGDTDLLCAVEGHPIYKMNVDGKSRSSITSMNVKRLIRHMGLHGSKYCIVVSPKFPRGAALDIKGEKVVGIRSDVLALYCSKECLSNPNYLADYESIEAIIIKNMGRDISPYIEKLVNDRYGISTK